MRIGQMNRLVSVTREVDTGDRTPANEPIYETRTVAKFWAQKTFKSADEQFAAEQRYAERIETFRTYWRSDLKETDTLIVDGKSYDIKGIAEVGFREFIDISAEWHD